jgi:hypothetical protein
VGLARCRACNSSSAFCFAFRSSSSCISRSERTVFSSFFSTKANRSTAASVSENEGIKPKKKKFA